MKPFHHSMWHSIISPFFRVFVGWYMSGHRPPIFGPKKSSKTSRADGDWRLRYAWGPYACRLVPVTICSGYHRTTLLGWEQLKLKASKVFVSLSKQFVFKLRCFFFRFFSEQLVSLLFCCQNIQLQIPSLPSSPSTEKRKNTTPDGDDTLGNQAPKKGPPDTWNDEVTF